MSTSSQEASPSAFGGHGPLLVGVSWALAIITTILLALRSYTRVHLVENGAGHAALLWAWAAWTVAIAGISSLTAAAHYGIGNHLPVLLELGTIKVAMKLEWIANAIIGISQGLAKIAVAAFLVEIQGRTYLWRGIFLYTLASTNLVWNIVQVFLIFFQCSPTARLWDQSIPGTCNGQSANYYAGIVFGAWNAATDLIFALYPIIIVYRLQMRLRIKLSVVALMGLGVFTAVCSIVKTVNFQTEKSTTDITYAMAPLELWGIAEMWVILITSSLPPIWPLIRRSIEHFGIWSSQYTFESSTFRLKRFSRSSMQTADKMSDAPGTRSSVGPGFQRMESNGSNDDNRNLVPKNQIGITRDITVEAEEGSLKGSASSRYARDFNLGVEGL